MKLLKSSLMFLLVVILQSCSHKDTPADDEIIPPAAENPQQEVENNRPEPFDLISIDNNATNVELKPKLSWQVSNDADGDPIVYDIYLDTVADPISKVGEDISNNTFALTGRLKRHTKYYWKVIAKDGMGGEIESINKFAFITRDFHSGIQATSNAPFFGRSGHTSVAFKEKIWVIGGYGNASYLNDVWYSSDGISWATATTNADFSPRADHTTVVFENKLWIIGGYDGENLSDTNDVWYSSDGITWTMATENAGFNPRFNHSAVVFEDKIWVIGGEGNSPTFQGIWKLYNDVWQSSDGINWTQVTDNAEFSKRHDFASLVFKDKIWVLGGSNIKRLNDIWYSDDGISWIQVASNPNFSPRIAHGSTVYDNKLWIVAGADDSGLLNDMWQSSDGIVWTVAIANPEFTPRYEHSVTTFDDKLWIIAGWYSPGRMNDVWYFD